MGSEEGCLPSFPCLLGLGCLFGFVLHQFIDCYFLYEAAENTYILPQKGSISAKHKALFFNHLKGPPSLCFGSHCADEKLGSGGPHFPSSHDDGLWGVGGTWGKPGPAGGCKMGGAWRAEKKLLPPAMDLLVLWKILGRY